MLNLSIYGVLADGRRVWQETCFCENSNASAAQSKEKPQPLTAAVRSFCHPLAMGSATVIGCSIAAQADGWKFLPYKPSSS